MGFCFSFFLFPLIFLLQQAKRQHNVAGAPQPGQGLAGPTIAPSPRQSAYLSDFVFSWIGLGKQKGAGEKSEWALPATSPLPRVPGNAVAPAPLGGSTELVKKLWQRPLDLGSCPT